MSLSDRHLIARFDSRADLAPQADCLRHGKQRLTYQQVRQRAQAIADTLAGVGAGCGSFVAYQTEDALDLLAVPLGVLAVGGAYTFIDPDHPVERGRQIVRDLDPVCLLLANADGGLAGQARAVLSLPDISQKGTGSWPAGWSRVAGADPFNVVYTSGTTGQPRGVLIPHRAVYNRLNWMWQAYPFTAGDVFCWHKSPGLVAAAWEMFGGLLAGIPTRLLPRQTLLDPDLLWQELMAGDITHFFGSPVLLGNVLSAAERTANQESRLRLVSSSGEALPATLARRFHRCFPGTTLLNMFGLTECSSNVAAYDTAELPVSASRVPVGPSVAGARILIVDGRLRPVPLGVEGEMLIGGECLALGYLRDEKLTAQRFVTVDLGDGDLGDGQPALMYRSGDRARLLPNGTLEYCGRTDDQVQVRGFRVELGDIQAALARHPSVRAAVVRARDDELTGSVRLAAYVAAADGLDLPGIRQFLREQVPQHMVPATVRLLETMPLTRSGKIDMAAIDELDTPGTEATGGAEPRTDREKIIADFWAEVLPDASFGIFDDFFDLGGHSVLAMRVIARLRAAFKIHLPVRIIFAERTIAGLAEAIDEALAGKTKSAIEKV